MVLVALTAFVSAEEMEVQDQEAAEQYMLTHGVVMIDPQFSLRFLTHGVKKCYN